MRLQIDGEEVDPGEVLCVRPVDPRQGRSHRAARGRGPRDGDGVAPAVMCVVIETYLGSSETGFTPISAVERYDGDRDCVAGAIELAVHGAPVITRGEWDDVNWLWPFVVQASADCRETGSGESYLPDQPILFRAERLPGTARVKLSLTAADLQRAAVADAEEYFRAVAAAGLEFLQHLDRLVPATAQPIAGQLSALRAWLP